MYRELIELYYDTEKPLPAGDFDWLCKKILAVDDAERTAVRDVLKEFFVLDGDVYRHRRCDEEIAVYKGKQDAAIRAGKASAKSRLNKRLTDVEQPLNERATNQEPRTSNQELETSKSKPIASRPSGRKAEPQQDLGETVEKIPLCDGSEFEVRRSFVDELDRLYPAVEPVQTLREMRGWCLGNPSRRKTPKGVKAFITNWFSREQDKQSRVPHGRT